MIAPPPTRLLHRASASALSTLVTLLLLIAVDSSSQNVFVGAVGVEGGVRLSHRKLNATDARDFNAQTTTTSEEGDSLVGGSDLIVVEPVEELSLGRRGRDTDTGDERGSTTGFRETVVSSVIGRGGEVDPSLSTPDTNFDSVADAIDPSIAASSSRRREQSECWFTAGLGIWCKTQPDCCAEGLRCYEKNQWFAVCLETCEEGASDRQGWSCRDITTMQDPATMTTTTAASTTLTTTAIPSTTTSTKPSTTTATPTTTTSTTTTTNAPMIASRCTLDGQDVVISFVGMGDLPYNKEERTCLEAQLRKVKLNDGPCDPYFLIHVGDIKSGKKGQCDDTAYRDIAEIFTSAQNTLSYNPADIFIVPGDNEWNDCGLFPPYEKYPWPEAWSNWISHFGKDSSHGFGTLSDTANTVERQINTWRLPGVDRQENFRFFKNNVLFVGINMVNDMIGDESTRISQNYDWVESSLARYKHTVRALVVFGHAGMNRHRSANFGKPFKSLLSTSYPSLPTLYLHGNGHTFEIDAIQTNLLDIQVEGRARAPPLVVSVLRHHATGDYSFHVDQQGGKYDDNSDGC